MCYKIITLSFLLFATHYIMAHAHDSVELELAIEKNDMAKVKYLVARLADEKQQLLLMLHDTLHQWETDINSGTTVAESIKPMSAAWYCLNGWMIPVAVFQFSLLSTIIHLICWFKRDTWGEYANNSRAYFMQRKEELSRLKNYVLMYYGGARN